MQAEPPKGEVAEGLFAGGVPLSKLGLELRPGELPVHLHVLMPSSSPRRHDVQAKAQARGQAALELLTPRIDTCQGAML